MRLPFQKTNDGKRGNDEADKSESYVFPGALQDVGRFGKKGPHDVAHPGNEAANAKAS